MSVFYVPAGIESYTRSGPVSLYSRPKESSSEKTYFGRGWKQWQTYTHEVAMVKGMNSRYLPKHHYDATISIFSPSFVKACGFKIILANPLLNDFDSRPYRKLGIYSIIDSGGYQMLREQTTFVHPDDVVERYNKTADIGMPLDIPMRSKFEGTYFDRVSRVMRENDKYIGSRLNPNVKLALISHGTNLDLRKRRLDVIDRPAEVIAVAGLNIKQKSGVNELFAKVEQLMYVTSRYKDVAKYFHVLGVTDRFFLFVYCLLSSIKFVKNIGADSVSHRMYSLIGSFMRPDFTELQLGKNAVFVDPVACHCPVCSVVHDARILHDCAIIEAHNLWVCRQRIRLIEELVNALLDGAVTLEYIHSYLNLRKVTLNEFVQLYDYIRNVAADQFKPLLKKTVSKGLFGKKEDECPTSPHYEAILKNYSKFYGKKF